MYLRVADTWHFLVGVLDTYSRYIVHWELLTSMRAADVQLVIQQAAEKTGARPEIVTDNGSQFTAKDFRALFRQFELQHIRIRTYHPESNGRIEEPRTKLADGRRRQEAANRQRAQQAA